MKSSILTTLSSHVICSVWSRAAAGQSLADASVAGGLQDTSQHSVETHHKLC